MVLVYILNAVGVVGVGSEDTIRKNAMANEHTIVSHSKVGVRLGVGRTQKRLIGGEDEGNTQRQ